MNVENWDCGRTVPILGIMFRMLGMVSLQCVDKTPLQVTYYSSSLQHILLLQCPYNYKQEAGHYGAIL